MGARQTSTTARKGKRKASCNVSAVKQKKAKRRVSNGDDADSSALPTTLTSPASQASQNGKQKPSTVDGRDGSSTDTEWAIDVEGSEDELGKHIQLTQL
jgi:hypothetical protein